MLLLLHYFIKLPQKYFGQFDYDEIFIGYLLCLADIYSTDHHQSCHKIYFVGGGMSAYTNWEQIEQVPGTGEVSLLPSALQPCLQKMKGDIDFLLPF